jgi:hypothetical protein
VWSGTLPDLSENPTDEQIRIYDAIVKYNYKKIFDIDPDVIDRLPVSLLVMFSRISSMENEKRTTQGSNNEFGA